MSLCNFFAFYNDRNARGVWTNLKEWEGGGAERRSERNDERGRRKVLAIVVHKNRKTCVTL